MRQIKEQLHSKREGIRWCTGSNNMRADYDRPEDPERWKRAAG